MVFAGALMIFIFIGNLYRQKEFLPHEMLTLRMARHL